MFSLDQRKTFRIQITQLAHGGMAANAPPSLEQYRLRLYRFRYGRAAAEPGFPCACAFVLLLPYAMEKNNTAAVTSTPRAFKTCTGIREELIL